MMGVTFVLMGMIYLFFDKVLILGYSPKDPTKPSFPSSHVLVVWTVFLCTMASLSKVVKPKWLRPIVVILMLVLMAAMVFGRVQSGDHTVLDVIGGAGMAVILSLIYGFLKRDTKKDLKKMEDKNE